MNKQRVAKEWLYFLGCFFFGFTVPSLPFLFFGEEIKGTSSFYSALFVGKEKLIAWVFVLTPYLLFQLVRSVIWAVKAARESK
jgi:hypothetical protein